VEGQKRHEYKFPVTRALGVSCIVPDSTRPTPTPRRRYFITSPSPSPPPSFLPSLGCLHTIEAYVFLQCVCLQTLNSIKKNHRTRKSNTKRLFFLYSLFTCSAQILHRSQGGFFSTTDVNMNNRDFFMRGGGGGEGKQ
jgi:hypothetical protein